MNQTQKVQEENKPISLNGGGITESPMAALVSVLFSITGEAMEASDLYLELVKDNTLGAITSSKQGFQVRKKQARNQQIGTTLDGVGAIGGALAAGGVLVAGQCIGKSAELENAKQYADATEPEQKKGLNTAINDNNIKPKNSDEINSRIKDMAKNGVDFSQPLSEDDKIALSQAGSTEKKKIHKRASEKVRELTLERNEKRQLVNQLSMPVSQAVSGAFRAGSGVFQYGAAVQGAFGDRLQGMMSQFSENAKAEEGQSGQFMSWLNEIYNTITVIDSANQVKG